MLETVKEETPPFASSISIGLAGRTFAWSIAVKCATSHNQPRVRSLRDPHLRELTALRNANEIVSWMGATGNTRDALPDRQTPSINHARSLLDAEEADRLRRFIHTEDRMSYLAAHAGSRLLLGAITKRKAETLRFERSEFGKPVLVDAPADLDFSMSHARGAVAVAAAYMPIGVDIEPLRDVSDRNEISEIVLASEERRILANTPEARQSELFLRYWTIKESVLKAAGVGFTLSPNTLIVDAGSSPAVLSAPAELGPPEQWRVIAPA
ncbi:4'-phosphopantetheinyl transferase [Nitrobacter sp. Nb-311A]|uniref:4'-phosphopantetheinyl transferase family protein n=1 Tax=Nitrobacter sp. TaxID=29420 RepID=UPI0000685F46|nr:4'-phosphopantetheinyl transferase superfamily protein [Nitrobacter sp.]EAQ34936.1 4'-phosphopantetheinyl transferase [Nitrobacter sp. Nb-311A]MCV0387669.1 4'-phosphopantetheinyl transferase superfamily protein [Nitrobacter sp.]